MPEKKKTWKFWKHVKLVNVYKFIKFKNGGKGVYISKSLEYTYAKTWGREDFINKKFEEKVFAEEVIYFFIRCFLVSYSAVN